MDLLILLCVHQVGILDIDLCGPSIPRMLNVGRTDVHQCDSGWVPVYTDAEKSLALMSIGFLLEDPDEAVVWRGPKKTGKLFSYSSVSQEKTCGAWFKHGSNTFLYQYPLLL